MRKFQAIAKADTSCNFHELLGARGWAPLLRFTRHNRDAMLSETFVGARGCTQTIRSAWRQFSLIAVASVALNVSTSTIAFAADAGTGGVSQAVEVDLATRISEILQQYESRLAHEKADSNRVILDPMFFYGIVVPAIVGVAVAMFKAVFGVVVAMFKAVFTLLRPLLEVYTDYIRETLRSKLELKTSVRRENMVELSEGRSVFPNLPACCQELRQAHDAGDQKKVERLLCDLIGTKTTDISHKEKLCTAAAIAELNDLPYHALRLFMRANIIYASTSSRAQVRRLEHQLGVRYELKADDQLKEVEISVGEARESANSAMRKLLGPVPEGGCEVVFYAAHYMAEADSEGGSHAQLAAYLDGVFVDAADRPGKQIPSMGYVTLAQQYVCAAGVDWENKYRHHIQRAYDLIQKEPSCASWRSSAISGALCLAYKVGDMASAVAALTKRDVSPAQLRQAIDPQEKDVIKQLERILSRFTR